MVGTATPSRGCFKISSRRDFPSTLKHLAKRTQWRCRYKIWGELFLLGDWTKLRLSPPRRPEAQQTWARSRGFVLSSANVQTQKFAYCKDCTTTKTPWTASQGQRLCRDAVALHGKPPSVQSHRAKCVGLSHRSLRSHRSHRSRSHFFICYNNSHPQKVPTNTDPKLTKAHMTLLLPRCLYHPRRYSAPNEDGGFTCIGEDGNFARRSSNCLYS